MQPPATADQLATVMRRVAAAPTDVYALLSAGELSIKLDDMSAAAAFFARAEKIDPRNGRAKAGMAAILVRAERPGEALRYFQTAEGLGHPVSRFAADRGLAYDLLGEQERAQRDYRLALRTIADDETIRRYALSLGISGRQALALEQLEPLTRRQDRAAWRVRAFVLAMSGDVAGASTIAVTMMPRGMAGGLQPFFERLPSLSAADRAFAVHFGEVRPTPARLADARMKPGLAPLGPDPFPPVRVAVARTATPPVVLASRGDRRRVRDRVERQAAVPVPPRVVASTVPRAVAAPERRVVASVAPRIPASIERGRVPVAVAVPVEQRREPVAVAATAPDPIDAPALAALRALAQIEGSGSPATVAASATTPSVAPTPVQVASAAPALPSPSAAAPLVVGPVLPPASAPTQVVALPTITPQPTLPSYSLPGTIKSVPDTSAPVRTAGVPSSGTPTPIQTANTTLAPTPVASATTSNPTPAATIDMIAASPGFANLAPGSAVVPTSVATTAVVPPLSATAVRSEDSILARIVASITIPGAELGVVQAGRHSPGVAAIEPATARVLAAGAAKAASQTTDRAAAVRTIAIAAKRSAVEARPVGHNVRGPRTTAERRAAERAELAEDSAVRAKVEKVQKDPERIWVQVAGGASEGDLPRAWNAAQKKAAVLKGRAAYVTPLRATNRVVTGPFKTDAEARLFVNQLAKQGVSAFQFKSVTGQKMTKLSAK
ncbi:SPOR domain-containing protein [uncultured Sphingomonas sp.]|uniref:SPOR domain-containing protein n=1 Tax=uncultured Sphingomonas sp. TaxID=158754 RepID=UPI0035CB2CA9